MTDPLLHCHSERMRGIFPHGTLRNELNLNHYRLVSLFRMFLEGISFCCFLNIVVLAWMPKSSDPTHTRELLVGEVRLQPKGIFAYIEN